MLARISRIAIVTVVAVLCLAGCVALSGRDEQITSFDVDYTIAASGAVHAIETISYDFAGVRNKHGIDRFLAARFSTADGNDRVYRYENIAVRSPSGASALFSTALGNALRIRIGNRNATVSGRQTYVLSYDIVGALNRAQQTDGSFRDEFFWNATGDNWTIPVASTTIAVHGPAAVAAVVCFAGTTDEKTPCAAASARGSDSVFRNGRLSPGEQVTIDTAFAAGTFAATAPLIEPALPAGAPLVNGGTNDGPDPFWTPFNWVPGILLLFAVPFVFGVVVLPRRRDQQFAGVTPGGFPSDPAHAPVEPAPRDTTIIVYYQPPSAVPVGAASTLLEKKRKTIDITATLVDLAVRGHLRIEEVVAGGGQKVTDYALIATPEKAAQKRAVARAGTSAAAELLPHETLLLDSLFAAQRTEVTLSSLKNSFAGRMRAIGAALDSWIRSRRFFLDRLGRIHPLVAWTLAGSVVLFIALNAVFDKGWLLIPIGAFAGAVIASAFSNRAARRSATGHAYYLQVEGFRQYIATAEADRIRFDEGEDVFSRYLPWAIVFGETERWARVFAELAEQGKFEQQPQWYVGNSFTAGYLAGSLGSIAAIGSAVNSFSELAATAMTSTPASSGGSGFGGGGGSGGGGGGGGGGSW